ncbi:hypothetical protein WJ542_11295 [Paraburkholderia sp. B3]|uniref:hypothetical protein n=1 Tax=Paraburkholderia sp. B3 TaxID=3134791 RepID=UPI003982538E
MIVTEENINALRGKAGIYRFVNPSGYVYVGSGVDLHRRLRGHERDCHNSHLRRSIAKHGFFAHAITVVEFIDIEGLSKYAARKVILAAEQRWIDDGFARHGDKLMMNIYSSATGSPLGFKWSEDRRSKLSVSKRKLYEDQAALSKLSAAHLKSYEDPTRRANNIAGQIKSFEDPARRAKHHAAMFSIKVMMNGERFERLSIAFEKAGFFSLGMLSEHVKAFVTLLRRDGKVTMNIGDESFEFIEIR